MLASFKKGNIGGVKVHVDRLQVTLGVFGQEEEVISNPLSPGVIKGIIKRKCCPGGGGGKREAVLQRELVIHIGWIISNNPELFSGMLKIRIGWIVQAMKHELKIRAGDTPSQDIYQLSPSEVKQLLMVVSIVLERNPELEFAEKVDLDGLVKEAFADFQRDRSRLEGKDKQASMEVFYNTAPTGQRCTSSYLTKAVCIQLLRGDFKPSKNDPCSVS